MIALLLSLLVGLGVCGELLRTPDLLSPALSPAALLGPLPLPAHNQTVAAGDLTHALSTMHFHRSMMNEYLCHNYLADEILSELRPLERRSGEPAGFTPKRIPGDEVDSSKSLGPGDQLLSDQGSASYREWLEKSAQLQDLYRGAKVPDQAGYETGAVTGFAVHTKGDSYAPPVESWGNSVGGGWAGGSGSEGGWTEGGQEWPEGSEVSGWGWEEHEIGKGLALKELFDLALTALAFLAFGVFVLNLIMTCLAKPPNMAVVLPGTTDPEEARRKRETASQLNELAFRVLTSVDKLLELQEKPELLQKSCLEYTICDNNKYSRALNEKNRIWLPVWSLGLSWLAGQQRGVSRLDHIRAAVLGLGNAECAAIYPHCLRTTASKQRKVV